MLRPGSFGGPQPKRGRSSDCWPVSLPVADEMWRCSRSGQTTGRSCAWDGIRATRKMPRL